MDFTECKQPYKMVLSDYCFRTVIRDDKIYCPYTNQPCVPYLDKLLKKKRITLKRYKKFMVGTDD